MTSRTLAKKIAGMMLSKKARDVLVMDLRKITSTTDFFVLCSADSDTQVKSVADAIRDGSESIGVRPWHYEGYHALSWVVLDFVDVVAHVFYKESRTFYKLERLWGDAKMTEVRDDGEYVEARPVKKKAGARPASSRKKKLAHSA